VKAQRTTQRPDGHSVSWSQLSQGQACGGKLKFKRARVADKDVGIFLLYGRALHAGLEARAKGRARTDQDATRLAVMALRHEIGTSKLPVSWDKPWKANEDGSISAASYGNLHSLEVAEWWLEQQVPLYLARYPDQQVVRSEHRIFVPLTPPPGVTWSRPWSLECWLDREMKDGSIHDIKSSGDAWDARDIRKYRLQALVYMAAYWSFYSKLPPERRLTETGAPTHFEFHVLPRMRENVGKGYRPRPELQVVRVEWNPKAIQATIDSVVKPWVTVIEQNAYTFNPGASLCNPDWCGYWDHCAFGAGDHL
jgi:hypothetical protein